MILLLLLAIYAALVSLAICVVYLQQRDRHNKARNKVADWFNTNPVTHESVKALSEFNTSQQQSRPWFEQSLSTIGVMAFIAMSITTAVQTTQGMNAESEAKQLRAELSELQRQKSDVERIVNSSIRALRDVVSLRESVDPSVKDLLRFHLQQVMTLQNAPSEAVRDALGTAILIGEYDAAGAMYRRWPDLGAGADPEQRLTLAEGLYILGQPQRAREVMVDVIKMRSALSVSSQRRSLVLDAVVNPNGSQARLLAALMGVSVEDAQRILDTDCERLRHLPAADLRVVDQRTPIASRQ